MSIKTNLQSIRKNLPKHVTLVAVSKTKPVSDLQEAYDAGQRIFGENKIQEMVDKFELLPKDIEWHMIGHVQSNKVKYMAPFVHLIHGCDSLKLLKEINKQAKKHNRIINCLLQIKIAKEDTKFGMHPDDASTLLQSQELKDLENVCIKGLMGMASFTNHTDQVEEEFKTLKQTFKILTDLNTSHQDFTTISMGMSGDYQLAINNGSTMVRVGSSIFGSRNYN